MPCSFSVAAAVVSLWVFKLARSSKSISKAPRETISISLSLSDRLRWAGNFEFLSDYATSGASLGLFKGLPFFLA